MKPDNPRIGDPIESIDEIMALASQKKSAWVYFGGRWMIKSGAFLQNLQARMLWAMIARGAVRRQKH